MLCFDYYEDYKPLSIYESKINILCMNKIPIHILLVIIGIAISLNKSVACSCLKSTTFFKSVNLAESIFEGVVLEHRTIEPSEFNFVQKAVLFKISKIYNGVCKNDTILVAESEGYECFGAKFNDGDKYVVHGTIEPIMRLNSNGRIEATDIILMPSTCTTSCVNIESNEVCGKLSLNVNWLNSWYYKLIGRIKQVRAENSTYKTECMELRKFKERLGKLKFKN